jgi:hypothetical protein
MDYIQHNNIETSKKIYKTVILRHNSAFDILESPSIPNCTSCQMLNYAEESLFFREKWGLSLPGL